MLIFLFSNDACKWTDQLLLLMLDKFDGIVIQDAVGGFYLILSMLVNLMIDCGDISIFKLCRQMD